MEPREIKLALLGDAQVGKNIGNMIFNIWDISGSHSTAQERVKWIYDSEVAIIMVDTADQASIENAVNWYREILSSQKPSDTSTPIPILIYSRKTYEKSNQHAIDPTEISWPNDLGDTPVLYNRYNPPARCNPPEPDPSVHEDSRPLLWILARLTGEKVEFAPPACTGIPTIEDTPELQWYRAEIEKNASQLPDEDDEDL